MDTVRVDICYRPLRIAWAIRSGNIASFRRAIHLTSTLCGGRFNPIVLIDRPEANRLVELFRADVVLPVWVDPDIQPFVDRFPHLSRPFQLRQLHVRHADNDVRATVLDVHNVAVRHPEIANAGFKAFAWDLGDPLSDAFLAQHGRYPEDIGIDYGDRITSVLGPIWMLLEEIRNNQPIPSSTLESPGISSLASWGLRRHYSVNPGRDQPGWYFGDATNLDDLVTFWNLRAADISVRFFDPRHTQRYEIVQPQWQAMATHMVSQRPFEHERNLAIWAREERLEEARALFQGQRLTLCSVSEHTWNGRNVVPPMMMLDTETSLGIIGTGMSAPRVSFSFGDKPYSDHVWFHTQHLVASLSIGNFERDIQHTFVPPYVPELNGFYSRAMTAIHPDQIRVEPERLGLIIDAADQDAWLEALPVAALAQRLFDLAGYQAVPSRAGLITRQLISRLGGVDGARVFKIPGVRRLIKTQGLNDTFTKKVALQMIGRGDPDRPDAKFSDHHELHIEARAPRTSLTPAMVFEYLVEKKLFRIGAELSCPTCRLPSWTALDQLQQEHICELCGATFDATRQLVRGEFRYRRTGVLGLERNVQGAVPVALLLQQLSVNVEGIRGEGIYLPSFDLTPKAGIDLPTCETDFFVLLSPHPRRRATIIIGECKDAGDRIDERDVENMRRVADAFPRARLSVYVLFAKLSRFDDAEIALARTLNGEHERRVILLTERELEPYYLYERTQAELGIEVQSYEPLGLAQVTHEIYFREG